MRLRFPPHLSFCDGKLQGKLQLILTSVTPRYLTFQSAFYISLINLILIQVSIKFKFDSVCDISLYIDIKDNALSE
jgi:hypothetical protein